MQRLAIVVALLLAFLGAPALALRGVEIGAQCERVERIESDLGSSRRAPPPKDSQPPRFIFFTGTHHGHEALISYTCEAGSVVSQLITLTFQHEQEATLAFSEIKRLLVAEFGEPWKDVDEPTISEMQQDLFATGDLPVQRFALGAVDKRSIGLMLSGAKGSWELLVHGP